MNDQVTMALETPAATKFFTQFFTATGDRAELPIAVITFNRDYYTRTESQSPDKIQEYAKSIEGGAFPPILVNHDGILLDGWHRWMAHKECGLEAIEVELLDTRDWDLHTIRRKAARANFRHGQPQTKKELKKLIRDEYRAKMEALDQPGREALKRDMAADYSRSERYIREVTSRIDKDFKAELREVAFDMWLACYSQAEIAAEVGYSQDAISQFIKSLKLTTNGLDAVSRKVAEISEVAFEDEEEVDDDPNSLGIYQLDRRRLVILGLASPTLCRPLRRHRAGSDACDD
jgi:hypothetical protein